MEFKDAYTAMGEGKRVRRKCWNEGVYLVKNSTGNVLQFGPDGGRGSNVKILALFEAAADDWEIVRDLTFSQALEKAKDGCLIARRGWNGKGQAVAYRKGYDDIPCNRPHSEAWGIPVGESIKVRPYLQMRCADGYYQMWTASQTDILAEDWYIVAPKPGSFEF